MSDLLTRRVSLRWYEGVAIVRAIAERLLDDYGTEMVPELHQIELLADGSVGVSGGVAADEPARRLGQLLQTMLTDASVPVQLRLVVSQATAPMPSYSSIADFDLAVEYFERPGRAGLLKAVFERAEAAGQTTASEDALTLDGIAPMSEAKPATQLALRRRTNLHSQIRMAAAFIVVVAVSSAAALYIGRAAPAAKGRNVSRPSVAADDRVGAAVLAGVSAVSDSLGLGRLVAADAADAEAAPRAAVLPLAVSDSLGPGRRLAAEAADVKAAPRAVVRSAPNPAMKVVRPVARPAEPVQPGAASVDARTAVVSDGRKDHPGAIELTDRRPGPTKPSIDETIHVTVYTPGDHGVTPPVALRAQLPQQVPPWVDADGLSRIELTIALDGSVESVKLLGNRLDVKGVMFLSAAKAWEFQPATKDGVPVRYRKTILVSF
jgi:hypothetical protein